jgi:hypothetical protein
MELTRRTFVAAAGVAALVGYTSRGDGEDGGPRNYDTPPSTEPRLPLSMSRGNPRENAISGGSPNDGIPSIDDPDALPRKRVYAFDVMWFAWSGVYPDSTIHE